MTADQWMRIHHFKAAEFDSREAPGSGFAAMQIECVSLLDSLRVEWGGPLAVTSGYRSPAHNTKVGGRSNSAHLRGYAVDLACTSLTMVVRLAVIAARLGFPRIGIDLHGRFIHLDTDPALPTPVTWFYNEPSAPEAPHEASRLA